MLTIIGSSIKLLLSIASSIETIDLNSSTSAVTNRAAYFASS